jgi:hypothetical protein
MAYAEEYEEYGERGEYAEEFGEEALDEIESLSEEEIEMMEDLVDRLEAGEELSVEEMGIFSSLLGFLPSIVGGIGNLFKGRTRSRRVSRAKPVSRARPVFRARPTGRTRIIVGRRVYTCSPYRARRTIRRK